MSLAKRDSNIIWHPFTQEQTKSLPIVIKKAAGSYLYDENNKAYLDLISSWWVNLHGHSNPTIAKAIYNQALTLEHVIFAGFTHEPAVQLCENLKKLLPEKLTKFFFSDNGSTSVEIAIKMAYQYWHNQGFSEKIIFLSFEGAYHGDTFGAMSVGATSGFHHAFSKLLFKVLPIPFAATWENDDLIEQKEANALKILEQHLINNLQIAAIILEPLIQGASGMRICRPQFINKVINLVRHYNILVIFDEVMTGFYRTGSLFAFNQTNIIPDFLCLSKGLTGGFLPLALTVTTSKIYQAFLDDNFNKAFAHGHSYTANPLGCSAAIASLELLNNKNTLAAIKAINFIHKKNILNISNIDNNKIKRPRVLGTIAAFDLTFDITSPILKAKFIAKALDQGLLLRPLGNTIYLLPPYSITPEELEEAYKKLISIL